MKLSALVTTVFILVTACSTEKEIVAADEYRISIRLRSNLFSTSDQVSAAKPMAKEHCAKHGKAPVFLSAPRPRGGERVRFGGSFVVVTFTCR
jgi:hypothetical protein